MLGHETAVPVSMVDICVDTAPDPPRLTVHSEQEILCVWTNNSGNPDPANNVKAARDKVNEAFLAIQQNSPEAKAS